MKKSLLRSIFAFALSLFCLTACAQADLAYGQGNQFLKVGFGLGATFSTGKTKMPPLQIIYEYGITDEISVGGIIGYASSSENYAYLGKVDYNYLIFGGRANYHFETGEKFDPYGGVTLGYNKVGLKDNGEYLGDLATSSIIYGGQIGANYYFTPRTAAWAEVGYGVGILNLGISIKF